MKKIFAFILATLMLISFAACSNQSGGNNDKKPDSNNSTITPGDKTSSVKPADIEKAIKEAIGKDGYLCDTDISAEDLANRYDLDMTKVETFVAKENSVSSVNLDTVIILQVKAGYEADAIKAINGTYEQTVSYIRQYPFGVAKVEGARLYQNGNVVALILAGANAKDNATAEDRAKTADAEYQKIDNAWKSLFGSLPQNQIVIPEDNGNNGGGGGLIIPDDEDMPIVGG